METAAAVAAVLTWRCDVPGLIVILLIIGFILFSLGIIRVLCDLNSNYLFHILSDGGSEICQENRRLYLRQDYWLGYIRQSKIRCPCPNRQKSRHKNTPKIKNKTIIRSLPRPQ